MAKKGLPRALRCYLLAKFGDFGAQQGGYLLSGHVGQRIDAQPESGHAVVGVLIAQRDQRHLGREDALAIDSLLIRVHLARLPEEVVEVLHIAELGKRLQLLQ